MKTGVILELVDGRATVLDSSGGFRNIAALPGWRVGDVVRLPVSTHHMRRVSALAACLLLVLVGAGGCAAWFTPFSLVSLDVNPSIELVLNRFDRVISARPLNSEGEVLLSSTDINGLDCSDAVSGLLGGTYIQPFLDGEPYVSLTIQSDSTRHQQELLSLVETVASGTVYRQHQGASVECHGVDSAFVEEAHGHGITAGKYLALLELQEIDPAVNLDDFSHCGLGDIKLETARSQSALLTPEFTVPPSEPIPPSEPWGCGGHNGSPHH